MTTNSFKGKIAIILGGTSGIGKATAQLLLEKGTTVHIVGKHQKSLDTALQELKSLGNVIGHKVDITDRGEVNSFINTINTRFSQVHYLVNAS